MFEKKERDSVIVYLHYNRDVRKLKKYGDIFYHSRRLRYVQLYVETAEAEKIRHTLEEEPFVKSVLPSYQKEIDQDFVGNLYR